MGNPFNAIAKGKDSRMMSKSKSEEEVLRHETERQDHSIKETGMFEEKTAAASQLPKQESDRSTDSEARQARKLKLMK